jgi:hypothetical protein
MVLLVLCISAFNQLTFIIGLLISPLLFMVLDKPLVEVPEHQGHVPLVL